MLQQPILSQAGTQTSENDNKTSTGSPHWEHYCTRRHSSCLHWKGKDLDYLRASFYQSQPKSYLHSLLNPSVFSFCRVGVKNTDLFEGFRTKLDMDSMCLRELHHSLLKLHDQPKKRSFWKGRKAMGCCQALRCAVCPVGVSLRRSCLRFILPFKAQ